MEKKLLKFTLVGYATNLQAGWLQPLEVEVCAEPFANALSLLRVNSPLLAFPPLVKRSSLLLHNEPLTKALEVLQVENRDEGETRFLVLVEGNDAKRVAVGREAVLSVLSSEVYQRQQAWEEERKVLDTKLRSLNLILALI